MYLRTEHSLTDENLNTLQLYSQKMQTGDIKFLGKLRGLTVDLDLFDTSKKVDYKTLGVLYLAKRLINDFFMNLATDSSFGLPEDSDYVAGFLVNLGQFIHISLRDKTNGALGSLFKAIGSYYDCLHEVENKV